MKKTEAAPIGPALWSQGNLCYFTTDNTDKNTGFLSQVVVFRHKSKNRGYSIVHTLKGMCFKCPSSSLNPLTPAMEVLYSNTNTLT